MSYDDYFFISKQFKLTFSLLNVSFKRRPFERQCALDIESDKNRRIASYVMHVGVTTNDH